jgi:hypothetical protein
LYTSDTSTYRCRDMRGTVRQLLALTHQ